MAKQNNTIFWIVGIAIFVFLILPNFQETSADGFVAIKVHYYDQNGNEIFPSALQESSINKLEKFKIELFRFLISTGPF